MTVQTQETQVRDIAQLHEQLIDYLKQGKFAEGIEDFYAHDVVAQENGNPSRTGRDALAAAEKEYLAGVTRYDGIEVFNKLVRDDGDGNGLVIYECAMKWYHRDGGEVHVQQAVVEHWRDAKIQNIRFYGTFIP